MVGEDSEYEPFNFSGDNGNTSDDVDALSSPYSPAWYSINLFIVEPYVYNYNGYAVAPSTAVGELQTILENQSSGIEF